MVYYSKFLFVWKLRNLRTETVSSTIQKIFSEQGIPEKLIYVTTIINSYHVNLGTSQNLWIHNHNDIPIFL